MMRKTTTTTHPQTPPSSFRPKDVSQPPQSQQTELLQILNILTLAYHRNKNQHRRSRWWKELSLLRRNLRRLLSESESDKERKNETGKDKEGFEKSTTFLREWLLPRCWVAFSGLVGDNQYAALGLMLLGMLARLGRVLGLDLKSEVADEGVDVGGEQGREESVVELGHESGWVDEDHGVPVAREEMVKIEETQSKESERAHEKTDGETVILKTEKPPAKVKRRKKNLDAIDELFSGLL